MNRIQRQTLVMSMGFVLTSFAICQAQAAEQSVDKSPAIAAPAACREMTPAEDWAGAGCRGDCLNTPEIDIAKKQPIPDVPGVEARNERPEASVASDVAKRAELPPCFEADYPSSAPSRYSRFLE